MSPFATVILVLVAVNIPLYVLIGKLFFGDWESFFEALKFWLTPEICSLFRGEYFEDVWSELKLGMWLVVCAATVYGEYRLICEWGLFGL